MSNRQGHQLLEASAQDFFKKAFHLRDPVILKIWIPISLRKEPSDRAKLKNTVRHILRASFQAGMITKRLIRIGLSRELPYVNPHFDEEDFCVAGCFL